MGYISTNLALTSACARLKRLQAIQPLQDLNTPQAEKNQRICKEAFKQLKILNEKILNSPTCQKRKTAYFKNFMTQSCRLGAAYGGMSRQEPDPQVVEYLTTEALKFKKTAIRFDEEKDFLTEEQSSQIEELARYPDFIEFCKQDSTLLDNAFNWSLLNRLSVRVLIEFPHIASCIESSLLKGRISTDPTQLKFHEKDGKKDVTLAFEQQDVSLLNLKEKVTFSNGLTQTVGSVFKLFQAKNKNEGHLIFIPGQGIINHDPMEYGPLNPKTKKVDSIDFNRPDWHRQLPLKAHLTQQEATEKFGVPCDGKNWVITVVAARQNKRYDIYSGHTFLRLAIPREDGTYDYTYGFGKFTKKYPQNDLHAAGYLFAPQPAVVQYPDNNEFYTHRQLKEFHYSVTPEKGAACQESWKKDIIESKKDNLEFQYLIRNCTDWTVEKIKNFIGEKESHMFDLDPWHKLEPSGFLGCLMKILRKVKDWFRKVVLNVLAFIFCGWKKMKITREDGTKDVVSIYKTPAWDLKRPFHHPGVAFRQAT